MKRILLVFGVVISLLSQTSCSNNKNRSRFSDNIDKAWIDYKVDDYLIATGNTKEVLQAITDEM
ncbi:MAG: hypothetical protein MJ213_05435, partial [Bacilli bacterium]|nr:hypothetical protein [Bacilli bacterium]